MRIKLAATAVMVAIALPLCAAAAQIPAALATPTMQFAGSGVAQRAPDIADLSLQIETRAPTAEEAVSRNAASVNKVVAQLKAKLADKGKVRAGGYSLEPEYDEARDGEQPKPRGYNAQNSITIETSATDLLGALMDSAIAVGAHQAVFKPAWWRFTSAPVSPVTLWSVNSLNFRLKDEAKVRAEALSRAAHDARAQAEAVATALGVKLRRVVGVSTQVSGVIGVTAATGPTRAAGPVSVTAAGTTVMTPIEPSDVTVTANVSVTYQIE